MKHWSLFSDLRFNLEDNWINTESDTGRFGPFGIA